MTVKTFFKDNTLRDTKWIKHVREDMHCLFTGSPYPAPAHLSVGSGTNGTGYKAADDSVLPISDLIHGQMHQHGEVSVLRMYWPKLRDEDFMFFARAGGEKLYRLWKEDRLPDNFFMR